jgi:hypothetical protein
MVEVPVHHYHRAYGQSQFFNVRRIVRTAFDVFALWRALMWCRKDGRPLSHAEPPTTDNDARSNDAE